MSFVPMGLMGFRCMSSNSPVRRFQFFGIHNDPGHPAAMNLDNLPMV